VKSITFATQAQVLIVAGKGGVGKTTVSAAVARLAASVGVRVLIVEVEGKSGLGELFGRSEPLSYAEVELAGGTGSGGVRARTLTPDDALVEYLEDHGLRRISKRLSSTGTLDVLATAVPGIRDILVLGKVKQLERARAGLAEGSVPELIVVDAPAAGHAVQFLASAQGLLDAVTVGPIRTQAQDVVDLLRDPTRCQVLLVTLPEETPVNELVDTAYQLEDRTGVQLGPVVVNGLYPVMDLPHEVEAVAAGAGIRLDGADVDALAAAARFRRRRQALQTEQVERLRAALPLPQVGLPHLFTTELGPGDVDTLAAALAAGVETIDPIPAGPVRG
jgi:anion-transporting  ArsA/GET3 family ATPase